MSSGGQTTRLLYDHAVLRAKLELKDYYLRDIVKEIFEQAGQVLSLVRIRLNNLENKAGEDIVEHVTDTGLLVGEVSAKLRDMSAKLFPENYLFTDFGFIKIIEQELSKSVPITQKNFQVIGSPATLPEGMAVILVVILFEIISSLQELSSDAAVAIRLTYTHTHLISDISFVVDQLLEPEAEQYEYPWENAGFYDRLSLIQGSYKKAGEVGTKKMVTLDVPIHGVLENVASPS